MTSDIYGSIEHERTVFYTLVVLKCIAQVYRLSNLSMYYWREFRIKMGIRCQHPAA